MTVRDAAGRYADDSFVERHELWTDKQYAAALQVQRIMDIQGIELVRVSFADQHGLLRGKTLTRQGFSEALKAGCPVPSTLVLKDTSHLTVYPVFHADSVEGMPQFTGVTDIVLVPDPSTFHVLPWAPETAWILSDVYFPDGSSVPFSTRSVLQRTLGDLAARGYDAIAGLEVEFHVFRLADSEVASSAMGKPGQPPEVRMLNKGYQLLTDDEIDRLDDVVQLLARGLRSLDMPVRSVELELGPSQLEVTFAPQPALEAADTMVLLRSAVKQLCRRHGYHATFMTRPHLADICSSGWHLHQSLIDRETGDNVFRSTAEDSSILSTAGRSYLGGLLEHAAGSTFFSTPTINGYKRFRPYSLAPDRVVWGLDNRGALIRTLGQKGSPSTRLENRSGEPAANPYLYIASQIVAGVDGLDRALDVGPATDEPYDAEAPLLPRSLMEALDALAVDTLFADRFGEDVVSWLIELKRAEVGRYLATVTDWEQREYFDLF